MGEQAGQQPLEWGVATRCRRGEVASGDLAVICPLPDGVLVAAIDGLGHGEQAGYAARVAGAALRENPSGELVPLVERCHQALNGTRGAAISLAFVSASDSTLTWLGVGSVEGRLMSAEPAAKRAKGSLALARGLPGHQLPKIGSATLDLRTGDVLLMATDGVGRAFSHSREISGSPRAIAERIMEDCWKPSDDALVVAARFLGRRS